MVCLQQLTLSCPWQVLTATQRFSVNMVLGRGACGTVFRGYWSPAMFKKPEEFARVVSRQSGLANMSAASAIAATIANIGGATGKIGQPSSQPNSPSQQMGQGGAQPVPGTPVARTTDAAAAILGFDVTGAESKTGDGAQATDPTEASRPVAVRVLSRRGLRALRAFCGDNLDLQKYRHRNLVPLLTFCLPGDELAGGQAGFDLGGTQAACLMYPLVCASLVQLFRGFSLW